MAVSAGVELGQLAADVRVHKPDADLYGRAMKGGTIEYTTSRRVVVFEAIDDSRRPRHPWRSR